MLVKFRYRFFFFNDTATTEIYTLSLHDALPISSAVPGQEPRRLLRAGRHRRELPRERVRADLTCASGRTRSEEHTSELQSRQYLVCRLLLEKKKTLSSSTIHTLLPWYFVHINDT